MNRLILLLLLPLFACSEVETSDPVPTLRLVYDGLLNLHDITLPAVSSDIPVYHIESDLPVKVDTFVLIARFPRNFNEIPAHIRYKRLILIPAAGTRSRLVITSSYGQLYTVTIMGSEHRDQLLPVKVGLQSDAYSQLYSYDELYPFLTYPLGNDYEFAPYHVGEPATLVLPESKGENNGTLK